MSDGDWMDGDNGQLWRAFGFAKNIGSNEIMGKIKSQSF